jgi:calcineurin-like phosphoesterase family protein
MEEFRINEQEITLNHYPMISWNKMKYGSWCLCGHTHGNYEQSRPEYTDGGKILDVGIDCHNQGPISFDEIHEIMKTKKATLV